MRLNYGKSKNSEIHLVLHYVHCVQRVVCVCPFVCVCVGGVYVCGCVGVWVSVSVCVIEEWLACSCSD